jgi:hypothetical protein
MLGELTASSTEDYLARCEERLLAAKSARATDARRQLRVQSSIH